MEEEFKFSNEIKAEEFISESNEAIPSLNASETRNDDGMVYEQRNCSTKGWNSLKWLCYHCGEGFNAYANLKDHKEWFHRELWEEEELFLCFDCEETLLGYSLFLNHIRSRHYDSLKLCCDACNDVLPDFKQLAVHRKEHMDFSDEIHPNVFHCTLCETVFSTEILFKLHVKDYHNNIRFDEDNSKDAGIKSESMDDTDEEWFPMVFQCGICVRSFKSESYLKMHMKSHNRKHLLQCDICSKTFNFWSDLKMHMTVHSHERPFKCDICSKSYKYSKHLKHHRNSHSDKELYKCDIRPKEFNTKKNLKNYTTPKRGRRPAVETDVLNEILLKYKNDVFDEKNLKVISKKNPIWSQIAQEIFQATGTRKTPIALYTRVTCRKVFDLKSSIDINQSDESSIIDDNVPPQVHNVEVVRKIESEYSMGGNLHKDPLTALCVLKSNGLAHTIHEIGAYPFYVYFSSAQQMQIYNNYCLANPKPKISVDATGRAVKKITRPDGSLSDHIFFYAVVIHTGKQQLAVHQMLSERQDADHISNWLRNWKQLGAPVPKEFVSDDNKTLLIAAISAFNKFDTITEYVNACFEEKYISCFVRIDNAHFMNKYAKILKSAQPLVKKFFLIAIGQLILARSLESANEILRSILITSQSLYSGKTRNRITECAKHISSLKKLAIENIKEIEQMILGEDEELSAAESEVYEDQNLSLKNLYFIWANRINDEVNRILEKECSDDPNPYYFPDLASKILNDCKELPLWSRVVRDRFGYGEVTASSASVESHFNNVKTRLLRKKIDYRADDFLTLYMNYISGSAKVID